MDAPQLRDMIPYRFSNNRAGRRSNGVMAVQYIAGAPLRAGVPVSIHAREAECT